MVDCHFQEHEKPVTFTAQNSKGSSSQLSPKKIITIADEAEITASTNVLLIICRRNDCLVRHVRA